MIVVYHSDNRITQVVNQEHQEIKFDAADSIALGLQKLAVQFPDQKLVWCQVTYKESLNLEGIDTVFHHRKIMLSYNPNDIIFFDSKIGYVETTPFIKVNKKVSYPTWQMSSLAGVVHASVILALQNEIDLEDDFDYFLCSLAKLGMPLGLLCYSEPCLLKTGLVHISSPRANAYTLFQFVKQHYRPQWVFLMLLNLIIYEKQFPIIPFLWSLFFKQKSFSETILNSIEVQSTKKIVQERAIDVIIPTIGRRKYLYDVLKDFRNQTLLPKKVIIVEQNPEEGSQSELDYIQGESWPFEISHLFIHQSGACNARNLALDQIQNEWVFLADDDNRFGCTLLADVLDKIEQFGNEVVTVSYLQQGENKIYNKVKQWGTFGAGNSFVRNNLIDKVRFNRALEFGYGEDADFGIQLRNLGADILYLPEPDILHLKAPIGGFRTKPVLAWHGDVIQPKPSPTVMLYQLLHLSKEQQRSYKTTLFFKYYKAQKIKNPIRYFINFRKQWAKSLYWANELKKTG